MSETIPPDSGFGSDDEATASEATASQPIPLSETVYRAIAAINGTGPQRPPLSAPQPSTANSIPSTKSSLASTTSKGGRLASQARTLAKSITASFVDRITAEAQKNGGDLNIQDIHNLEGEFEKKTDALQLTLENALDDFARAREQSHFSLTREHPFDRLFVSEIDNLFVSDEEAPRSFHKVSRRILPGFFKAMSLMMTPDLIDEYQERTRAIVKRVSEGREDDFTWDDVFVETDAQDICLEAQVAMAFHFKELDKRSQWFVNLINENLPPLPATSSPAAHDWRLTPQTFREVVSSLFNKLRKTLDSEMGEIKITLRHGAGTCGALISVLDQVDN